MPVVIGLAVAAALLLTAAIVARVRATILPRALVVEYSPVQPPRRTADAVDDAILVGRERRAVAAGLLQLATTRKVRLAAETSDRGRVAVGVELLDEGALTEADTALLEALFGPGHPRDRVRRFSRDRRLVGRRVRAFVDRRTAQLTRRGLLRASTARPRQTVRVIAWILLLIAVPPAVLTLIAGAWLPGALCAAAAIGLIAALWIVPPGERNAPTTEGEQRRVHLDGLRQYMTLAEADRIRFLQSPAGAQTRPGVTDATEAFILDERLLPWAVVFGIEREWLAHLKIAYDELDGSSLHALGEVADGAAELLQVGDVLGSLVDLGFAVGDLVDVGGTVVEVVGGAFDAIS